MGASFERPVPALAYPDGLTPAYAAATTNRVRALKFLRARKVDLWAPSCSGRTPAVGAALHDAAAALEVLRSTKGGLVVTDGGIFNNSG